MQSAPVSDPTGQKVVLPSWLLSAVFHAVLIAVLVWTLRGHVRGIVDEPSRDVGIVLKHTTDQGDYFEGENDLPHPRDAASESAAVLAALPSDLNQLDPSDALPESPAVLGIGVIGERGLGNASALTQGTRGPRSPTGGQARVRVYGLVGEGRKFVYVFDRSVSMDGARLASAKSQLLQSLDSLESTHQFQVIFFNHNRQIFDLTRGQRRIPFATERNKAMAAKFVAGITAAGGTDRAAALLAAVRMGPDVIFFLTDAEDSMAAGDVERIRRSNRGPAAIHAIEFGAGPAGGENNFLIRLARQSGGSHVYVDTSKLRP